MARYDINTYEGRVQKVARILKNSVPQATVNGITGILACWTEESQVDPQAYETDFLQNSPTFEIGQDDFEPTAEFIFGSWDNFNARYNYTLIHTNYLFDGKHFIGYGLGQWTASRTYNLFKFAKDKNQKVSDFNVQLRFALEGEGGDSQTFKNHLISNDTASNLTYSFGANWERNTYSLGKYMAHTNKVFAIVDEELKNGNGTFNINSDSGTAGTNSNSKKSGTSLGANVSRNYNKTTTGSTFDKELFKSKLKEVIDDFEKMTNCDVQKLSQNFHNNSIYRVIHKFNRMEHINLNHEVIELLYNSIINAMEKSFTGESSSDLWSKTNNSSSNDNNSDENDGIAEGTQKRGNELYDNFTNKFIDETVGNSGARDLSQVKYIVLHGTYTTSVQSAVNAWTGGRQASANYIVHEKDVYGVLGDNIIAWHSGGTGSITNNNSIGIEHVNKEIFPEPNGKNSTFSKETMDTGAHLVARLCKRLQLPPTRETIKLHREASATACPQALDVDYYMERVQYWYNRIGEKKKSNSGSSSGSGSDIPQKVHDVLSKIPIGQRVGNGQCYGLASWYSHHVDNGKGLGCDVSWGRTAKGDTVNAWNLPNGWDWTGWEIITQPTDYNNIKKGDIYTVVAYSGAPHYTLSRYGHVGIVAETPNGNTTVSVYDQNGPQGQVVAKRDLPNFLNGVNYLLRPKNI